MSDGLWRCNDWFTFPPLINFLKSYNLHTSASKIFQILNCFNDLERTRQTKETTLLKMFNYNTSPPISGQNPKLCTSWNSWLTKSPGLKCPLTAPASQPFPLCQECLVACCPHKPPKILCSVWRGTILQSHVGHEWGDGARGDICSWQLPRSKLTCWDNMKGVLGNTWAKHLRLMRTFMLCVQCLVTGWVYPEGPIGY